MNIKDLILYKELKDWLHFYIKVNIGAKLSCGKVRDVMAKFGHFPVPKCSLTCSALLTRKMDSFQLVTGILGQTHPLFSPIQLYLETCTKVGWNQPIWKTWQIPSLPRHSLEQGATTYFTARLRRCSLADCRRLTDPPYSSGCPFYEPCSLCFPLSLHFHRDHWGKYTLHWDSVYSKGCCFLCSELAVTQVVCCNGHMSHWMHNQMNNFSMSAKI